MERAARRPPGQTWTGGAGGKVQMGEKGWEVCQWASRSPKAAEGWVESQWSRVSGGTGKRKTASG